MILDRLGRFEEAVEVHGKSYAFYKTQESGGLYAIDLRRVGRIEEARDVARAVAGMSETMWGAYNLACFWAVDANPAESLRMLRRAFDLGYTSVNIFSDPDLAALHGNPDFEEICRGVRERIDTARRREPTPQ